MSHPADGDFPLKRFEMPAIIIGALAAVACAIGAVTTPAEFYRSYLVAFVFWFAIAAGSLTILMLQYVTGGRWGVIIRRPLEAATATLPLLALLFVPVALGIHSLYHWSHEDVVKADVILSKKAAYLNQPFFLVRAAIFFLIWNLVAWLLRRWGREYDRTRSPFVDLRVRSLSSGGLLLMVLTLTFASVDWMMSLEPHWFSTMYGISFTVGCALSAFTFMIIVVTRLMKFEPMASMLRSLQLRDLGNLTFAFVMLWAYTAFSQFLLIWYANIKEEVPYYASRTHGVWGTIALVLVVFHFFLPFFMLLMRGIKDRPSSIAAVAAVVLVMRFVDLFWLIKPAFYGSHFQFHWLDIAAPVAVGGFWLAAFLRSLRQHPVLPMNDPLLEEVHCHG